MLKLEIKFKSSFVPCEIALFKLNAFSLETKKQKSRFDLKILKASHKSKILCAYVRILQAQILKYSDTIQWRFRRISIKPT